MNDVLSDKRTDFICYCSGTTKEKIKELVDNGIDNLDSISRLTGACAGCGACENEVTEFITAHSTSDIPSHDSAIRRH